MQQLFADETYFSPLNKSSLIDHIIRDRRAMESRRTRLPKYFEHERDVANTIENMSAKMASLEEALSITNALLKVTNDLLIQIAASLSISEAQSYFWTKEWQKAESEASHDIAAGNLHTFEDVEQLIHFLHSK